MGQAVDFAALRRLANAPDRRAYVWLILGGMGSGKTYQARMILNEYVKKPDYIAIVNTTNQLIEYARFREVVDIAALKRGYTVAQLKALLRRWGSVHFEVSTGADYKLRQRFMDNLGQACMGLGRQPTNRCHVLLVIDECQNFISKRIMADCEGMRRVLSEGRKFGVDTLLITQQLSGTGAHLIDMDIRRMMNILVICNMDEPNECDAVLSTWPELRDPSQLRPPDPKRKRPSEFMVRDRNNKRALIVRVSSRANGGWKRRSEPLAGRTGPPRRNPL